MSNQVFTRGQVNKMISTEVKRCKKVFTATMNSEVWIYHPEKPDICIEDPISVSFMNKRLCVNVRDESSRGVVGIEFLVDDKTIFEVIKKGGKSNDKTN